MAVNGPRMYRVVSWEFNGRKAHIITIVSLVIDYAIIFTFRSFFACVGRLSSLLLTRCRCCLGSGLDFDLPTRGRVGLESGVGQSA